MGYVRLALTLAMTAAGGGQAPTTAKLSPPSLRVEVVSPTMVRLVADTASGERAYQIGVRKRADDGVASPRGVAPLQGESYLGTRWTGVDSVRAGTTYRYQARTESGTTRQADSDWSSEIVVTTPPPPRDPPAAPSALTARAVGSTQVELSWRVRSRNQYGFEILARRRDTMTRLALVNPEVTRFTVHGVRPGTTVQYAVRAFNPAGASEVPPSVAVALPNAYDAISPLAVRPIGPCVTRDQTLAEIAAQRLADEPTTSRDMQDAAGRFEAFSVPGSCGNANCAWHLYSVDVACYRKLGEFFAASLELSGRTPQGAPIFLELGHMGGMRTNVGITMVKDGRLVEVDRLVLCEPQFVQPTKLAPVFEECQFDFDLSSPPVAPRAVRQ